MGNAGGHLPAPPNPKSPPRGGQNPRGPPGNRGDSSVPHFLPKTGREERHTHSGEETQDPLRDTETPASADRAPLNREGVLVGLVGSDPPARLSHAAPRSCVPLAGFRGGSSATSCAHRLGHACSWQLSFYVVMGTRTVTLSKQHTDAEREHGSWRAWPHVTCSAAFPGSVGLRRGRAQRGGPGRRGWGPRGSAGPVVDMSGLWWAAAGPVWDSPQPWAPWAPGDMRTSPASPRAPSRWTWGSGGRGLSQAPSPRPAMCTCRRHRTEVPGECWPQWVLALRRPAATAHEGHVARSARRWGGSGPVPAGLVSSGACRGERPFWGPACIWPGAPLLSGPCGSGCGQASVQGRAGPGA